MTDGLIIDLFAGGGGASTGIEMALGRHVDIAVDHDPEAIRIHKTNHPGTLHLTEDVFRVNLQEYVKGRHVALMWASPDCTQFSRAKGGKPREKGQRVLPWAVHMHVAALKPDVVIMENVEEIQKWGPLDGNGYPVWERAGEDYKKFICAMSALGYVSDSRELVAADYGAPTTRKRWYAVFWRDGRAVTFPERTHSRGGINGLKPWEPICKYLDLQDFGKSIFGRKKPLAENTMKRIARGLGKFVSDNPETLNSDIPAVLQEMFGGGQPVQGTSRGNTPEMHMDVTVYHGVLRMRHRAGYKGTTAYNSDERTVCVNHSGWEQTCNTGFFSADAEAAGTDAGTGVSGRLYHGP
ncbi:C-5 cytosine-specific DNA methylase [Marvinbryantia formatexigens DSM 14469]|uniref:DNA (cytosine-5-)-methyltransferase n=1 Tax=Marvinbryantia formatexigens DSM 14469 TaxID=478749 RepID=C6L9Y6_9FIRM|nr:DNA cytosine methyltransferase [Marvinbryantia formatexigens]EET62393.1 C-5 cytosine-specific DNA methylase [Marvinbryantia formatexigens DSM 14469]UWO25063.1 DNA cytosine methyltransferase [Marvinbryantia formatexigens DSM 14469]SDG29262.1 C-5 cytosine-specific DNA methylase [Marvinbryantia formatexigens]